MAFADIAPAGLFMNSPEKLFHSDEPDAVRHKPELIRPVGQNVDKNTAEVCDPNLAFSAQGIFPYLCLVLPQGRPPLNPVYGETDPQRIKSELERVDLQDVLGLKL